MAQTTQGRSGHRVSPAGSRCMMVVLTTAALVAGAACSDPGAAPGEANSEGPVVADASGSTDSSSAASEEEAPSALPVQMPEGLPGGEIAFRRFDQELQRAALFVMSTDGTGARPITEPGPEEVDNLPDWSPDGTQIAFERIFPGRPNEVFVVNADGSDEHPVDPGCPVARPRAIICEETAPSWSADGRQLLFGWPYGEVTGGVIDVFAVGIMDADGRNAQQLTNLTTPTTYEDFGPEGSPDGTQIAFLRWNSSAKPVDATAVFVMNADGTGQHRITPWNLRAEDIAWAPDGTALTFRSETGPNDFEGDLYTVAPDGTGLTKVTDHDPGTMTLGSSWSPDSQWIVFARTGIAGLPDLYVMRRDGSELTPLTRTPVWDSAPAWSPGFS